MSKGYWIVRIDVTDAERFAAYLEQTPKVLASFGGRFLARGGPFEAVEGAARARNSIIEFPSYEAALSCYRSADYSAARQLRLGAAEVEIVVIAGKD